MSYLENHMSQVFPFDTGGCTQVTLGANCNLTPFLFVSDPVRVSAVNCTDFSFATLSSSKIGSNANITFSAYEQNGDVYLRQTAHTPNADWLTNILAPVLAMDTWQEQARNLRSGLGVGSDGGPPLPGGLTPQECWSMGVC